MTQPSKPAKLAAWIFIAAGLAAMAASCILVGYLIGRP